MDRQRVEERWGSAEFTQSLASISWMASTAVQMHLNERATGDPALDWLSAWAHRFFLGSNLRILVLGCGEGWLERALARRPFVASIDAVDLAGPAIERARDAAAHEGLTNIRYTTLDLNRDALPPQAYDAVIAHSILHHVEDLDHASSQIERTMKPDATLIVNEYVGPDRFQFDDGVLRLINELLRCLPPRLRRSALRGTTYQERERPPLQEVIAADPSEAIRASELRPFLTARFDLLDSRELGGTLLQHLLYDIVQNFRFEQPRERAMLDLLGTFEGALIDRGELPSDFALFALRRKSSTLPATAYRRARPPRPAAALEVDADPLGFSGRTRRRTGRVPSTFLPGWALRMLRTALVSNLPARRNLIVERAGRTTIEQLRYAAAPGTGVFDWIIGRWLPHADLTSEDCQSILNLLETFERFMEPGEPVS